MRVLVAGIGNVFLGDDAFGVEVVARLAGRELPAGVEVADFGTRAYDLAYALMDGCDAAVLVDALPRGEPAGTLCLLEPDLDDLDGFATVDSHAMNPMAVLAMVRRQGGTLPPTWIVGCEPGELGRESEDEGGGRMGLSQPVAAAIDAAADMVEALVSRLSAPEGAVVRRD
jgi:hydrogenase maturation protease